MKINELFLNFSKENEQNFLRDYLIANNIKPEDVDVYLHPNETMYDDPFDYPRMNEAIELTKSAIENEMKIGIVVDSDADGYCSASLAYLFLRHIKSDLDIQVFTHTAKQHGIHDLVSKIIESEIRFLIIPDAGTNSADDCAELAAHDVKILVLDHHEIENENRHCVLINPHCGEKLNMALSGTGVVDKWARAYCQKNSIEYPGYEDLVAVSLATDVCDLRSLENRAYMYFGLKKYGADNVYSNKFIEYLFNKNCRRGVTPEGIIFGIGPLVNALARCPVDEQQKMIFFSGLTGTEIAEDVALRQLRSVKSAQDSRVKIVVEELEGKIDNTHKVIFAFIDKDDAPYSGLIAGKLCGEYNKPTLVLRELNSTMWSGSLRSPEPIADKINATGLANCMGHLSACGIVIKKSNLNRLAKWFDGLDIDVHPADNVTAKLNAADLDLCRVCMENKQLWGKGMPEPTFYFDAEVNRSAVQILGKNRNTIKISSDGIDLIKFFADSGMIDSLTAHEKFRLEAIYKPNVNEYMGIESAQGFIEKFEVTPIEEKTFDFDEIFS